MSGSVSFMTVERTEAAEGSELRPWLVGLDAPALARGETARFVKAGPVRVRPDMTVAQGFQAIVAACIRHFRLNEPGVIEHRDGEALHQARVALRRLRSVFSLFRPVIADHDFERLHDELRWFTAELGDARNLDVLLERGIPDGQRERLTGMRGDAYRSAIAAMESARSRRLMLDLVSWVARGEWREHESAGKPLGSFADGRIDRLWRKVSRARKLRAMDDRKRHRLRIRVKKLRYALEFVAALHVHGRKKRKKFARAMEQVQEALGHAHDLAVARSFLPRMAWPPVAQEVREKRRHVRDAKRSLRALRRIGPYWRNRRG
jgi:triphosphatase